MTLMMLISKLSLHIDNDHDGHDDDDVFLAGRGSFEAIVVFFFFLRVFLIKSKRAKNRKTAFAPAA